MKIKDLPNNTNLGAVRFRAPDGEVYYWYSQWEKGIWGKKNPIDAQVFPIFVNDLKESLEFEVVS